MLTLGDEEFSLAYLFSKGKPTSKTTLSLDSAAAANVLPKWMFPEIPLEPSPCPRRGQYWLSANGKKIYNLGQKLIKFRTAEGHRMEVMFQIADVTKPLLSAQKVTEAGNEIRIDKDSATIISPKKSMIKLRRQNGVFVFDITAVSTSSKAAGFTRPGR